MAWGTMKLPSNVEVIYQNEWWTFLANRDSCVNVCVPSDEKK